ncbi:MAG: hypothetical protein CVV27_14135 [Candidatus Melainabacteria bacterium HGW-Melainabacteria-1]|nr:MAG: hypothetical protein CVV27_14135 [Candidatus Melainabacteria bacterium HGW-Melainabacteria-1]
MHTSPVEEPSDPNASDSNGPAGPEQEPVLDEDFYRTLIQAIPDGIALIGPDGNLLYSSPQMLELLAVDPGAESPPLSPLEAMLPADRERARQNIGRVLQGGPSTGEVYGFMRGDGDILLAEIKSAPLKHADGSFRGMVSILRDVTRRQRAEAALQAQNEQLRELNYQLHQQNDQLDEFSHIVSHDLRGPVGNLNLLLGLMRRSQDPAKKAELLGMVETVAANLQQTLGELVELVQLNHLSELEAGSSRFEVLCQKACDSLSAQIDALGADIEHDFSAAPELAYPKVYLESLFYNLLSNALKFTGERPPQIRICSKRNAHDQVVLSFSDNGLGLDLSLHGEELFHYAKVFHPGRSGKGMGLYLIKKHLTRNGGEISVSSAPDQGMTFTITFKGPISKDPSPIT